MKRILVLTPRFPFPPIGGDRLRIYELCKYLSKFYELTLVSFCESRQELELDIEDDIFHEVHRVYKSRLSSFFSCSRCIFDRKPLQVHYYHSRRFLRLIDSLKDKHDFVLPHLVRMTEYAIHTGLPFVVEMTDAISLNFLRIVNSKDILGFRAFVYRMEHKRLFEYEVNVINNALSCVLVSAVDRDYFLQHSGKLFRSLSVYSNGVEFSRLLYNYQPDGETVLFIGNMYSLQNWDGVTWFIKEVMPILREKTNGRIRLLVVGKIKDSDRSYLNEVPNVYATGLVESISQSTLGSSVAVCPIRIGAGVQNKVLEYLSIGVPCVSTKIGTEGLHADCEQVIEIANDAEEFANKVFYLMTDTNAANSLSNRGRNAIESHYSWENQLKGVESLFVD